MVRATWGDSGRGKAGAPIAMRPGAVAEVVGIRDVETPEQSDQFQIAIGSKVFLIEFSSGDAMDVAEIWIENVVP